MPDGQQLTHPFLILSCEAARQKEPGFYYGVMMTTSSYVDRYSFPISQDMFDGHLPKEGNQIRLYIISSFRESDIDGLIAKMKKPDFKNLMTQLKDYSLPVD